MCDKAHFERLEGRVDKIELDLVKHTSSSEVQIANLLKATNRMFWSAVIFGLILLLSVCYGALGERGFRHVACAAQELAPTAPGK